MVIRFNYMLQQLFRKYYQKRLEKRNIKSIEDKGQIKHWGNLYFSEIKFPILILDPKGYLAVSDLEEYYLDDDIHYPINENCKLLDSEGKTFTFQKIDNYKWVPDKNMGIENFESFKQKLIPLLFMPNHIKNIEEVKSFKSMIELLHD